MEMTIKDYLKEIAVKVKKNESCSYIELMMDDHKCISYGGIEYYIPDSMYSNEEVIIFKFLSENYGL